MLKAKDWKGNIIGSNGGNIDFIECAWNRNIKECGDFMVYLTLSEYNRLNKLGLKYVENVGRQAVNCNIPVVVPEKFHAGMPTEL